MKKIIVFGGTGGVGTKLIPLLQNKYEVVSIGSKDVDVTSFSSVKKFFDANEYDIVLTNNIIIIFVIEPKINCHIYNVVTKAYYF